MPLPPPFLQCRYSRPLQDSHTNQKVSIRLLLIEMHKSYTQCSFEQ